MVNIFSSKSTLSEDVFEILFKEHYPAVYRILYTKYNNHDICEEATQEAFHTAYKKLNQLRDKNKFFPWVLRIAINKANDLIEKYSLNNIIYLDDNLKTDSRSDSDFMLVDTKDEVFRILNKVKPDDREILILRYYLDMTIEEIADFIQITPANAKSRLHRARENYKKAAGLVEENPPKYKGSVENGNL